MTTNFLRGASFAVFLLVAVVACSDDGDDPTDPGCTGFPCEEDLLFDADYMTNPAWAEVIGCTPSNQHGLRMRVHIFPASAADFYLDMGGRDAGFDEGTILVKTEYNAVDCNLAAPVRASVMRKGSAGTAPATGDWEWQQVDYVNESLRTGQLNDCLSAACHTSSGCGPDFDYTCVDPDA